MDAIEYFKGMRKRLCEDHLKLLPKKSVGYQTTLREMSFYDAAIKALEQEPCEDAISRTDAIRVASGYCHWSNIPKELAKLPSVNPIPCEDAISRQETIEWLKKVTKTDGITFETGFKQILHDIGQMPSVSTEKTGRWEWNQYDYNPNLGNWHCSECGSIVIECVPKKDPNGVPLYKYCPQCGCRLVEPQESEE